MGEILIGTSGYAYRDWRGPFYPEDLAREDYLRFYAERFSVAELVRTGYRMPEA